MNPTDPVDRYQRQIDFAPWGQAGQEHLRQALAVVIGVGGLGSWVSELLTRAGVGRLRLIDDDRVETVNLHRQALFTEADARAARPKAEAAAARLAELNREVAVETVIGRVEPANIADRAAGATVLIDATDNFAARFLINDHAFASATPWVFAGVGAAGGQVMAFVPPARPCLRCLYESPPPEVPGIHSREGFFPPVITAIAALAAAEALKFLTGRGEAIAPRLLRLDLWGNTVQTLNLAAAAAKLDCPCCVGGQYRYLYPGPGPAEPDGAAGNGQ